ncbi:hypothetical protein MTR67_024047 [Solanum verrucosum]|uniref:NB-ARC domain-containing protein n=1 Tax=Solanum verrucosum TaxID=315347 RepID=A0AAF0QY30_SOLVR|nr:hypothetical protein MTR67_024047 [Solanum verrucosum]
MNWIIRKLTSGPTYLDVISITGMPSTGKTILEYKVYNDKSVSSHFDIRSWCTVGQEYDEKKLVDKFLNQVIGSDSKLSENVDVADKIRKQLYGKRSEESWGLFEERVLGNKSCPNELLDVGKEIAQNCEGLPLMVDLIAGVIERKEKKKNCVD